MFPNVLAPSIAGLNAATYNLAPILDYRRMR